MVTSNHPLPKRRARHCIHCSLLVSGHIDKQWVGFCKKCGWSKTYPSEQEAQCFSCFNNVGSKGKRLLCAALMYKMPDGTWRDRYNKASVRSFKRGAISVSTNVEVPVTPSPMDPQYDCECYEDTGGKTREQIRLEDPLKFYSKKRFW